MISATSDGDTVSTASSNSSDPCSSSLDGSSCRPAAATVPHKPHERVVDLFGVQLEVTGRLLEAERRKLGVLQRTIEARFPSVSADTLKRNEVYEQQLRVNLRRIQQQYDQLQTEYEMAARGQIRSHFSKTARSQPAIGLKQAPKPRPTIFGTVAKEAPSDGAVRICVGPPQQSNQVATATQKIAMATSNGYRGVNGVVSRSNASSPDTLVYQDAHLQAGSVEALIQHLVPTPSYYPETCIHQQSLNSEKTSKESLAKFGPHLIQLLGEWTDNFPYDFRDERLMRSLKDITQRLVVIYPELRKDVGILMHNLIAKLSGLQKYEDLLSRINAEVAQRLLNIMPNTDIYEVCSSPLVLAQQLTHIELERLSMIGAEEFVEAFAKENGIEQSVDDVKQTSNLESYVHWFNRLSYFVATEICMHLKKKNRVRMIEYFIDVAKECVNIGNFNSLMAIIAGLNMNPIQRLKKTWEKVNKEKFDILEHQMNPSNNFGSYRSSLKAALWRSEGAVEDRERIVIPFFSLLVKDMYFLNEGCANRMDSGLVNFEKFWQLAKQVTEFLTWKQVECPFDRHPPVLNYLLTNPVFSENSLALASFECEPPDNNYEKDRYKQLKEQAGL